MIDVKASVSIILPGSVMYTNEECQKNPELGKIEQITYFDTKDKANKILRFRTRKTKPAIFRLNISEPQFKAMMAASPKDKKWAKMTNKAKMDVIVSKMCADMNGLGYTYDIFN